MLRRGANTQAVAQLFEGVAVLRVGAVEVFAFRNQFEAVVALNAGLA